MYTDEDLYTYAICKEAYELFLSKHPMFQDLSYLNGSCLWFSSNLGDLIYTLDKRLNVNVIEVEGFKPTIPEFDRRYKKWCYFHAVLSVDRLYIDPTYRQIDMAHHGMRVMSKDVFTSEWDRIDLKTHKWADNGDSTQYVPLVYQNSPYADHQIFLFQAEYKNASAGSRDRDTFIYRGAAHTEEEAKRLMIGVMLNRHYLPKNIASLEEMYRSITVTIINANGSPG